MENNKELKYQYHLKTWGGFYNKEHNHGHKPGDFFFNTEKERKEYLDMLQYTSRQMNAHMLATTLTEGYHCDIRTCLHRVVEWEGKRYYSFLDMGINYPYSAANYHLEWKWYPGFNDYPLGEEFDYEKNQVSTIQEWITGAFNFKPE